MAKPIQRRSNLSYLDTSNVGTSARSFPPVIDVEIISVVSLTYNCTICLGIN